ncbi:MAG: lytic murein transglycosylase [Hyphomicrobiales bacterium]|nr:lytic murein transglycosylase [Hyphomicrobiales bacterium]
MLSVLVPDITIAAECGNNAGGFKSWLGAFHKEAASNGIKSRGLNSLNKAKYLKKTIRLDRNQKSFRYSLKKFMRIRGANTIIKKGKSLKKTNRRLFTLIEKRYGVPAGPLLAIWGMETGFGRGLGNAHTISAVATLAYDCRRSAFFTKQLYAGLKLVDRGMLRPAAKGAAHGEIGQTQFLPANVLKYGVDGDGNGRVDLVGSIPDALASTANFLRSHGWKRGAGYQPGQKNFAALRGWNAAGVYQKAIAIIGSNIDG